MAHALDGDVVPIARGDRRLLSQTGEDAKGSGSSCNLLLVITILLELLGHDLDNDVLHQPAVLTARPRDHGVVNTTRIVSSTTSRRESVVGLIGITALAGCPSMMPKYQQEVSHHKISLEPTAKASKNSSSSHFSVRNGGD